MTYAQYPLALWLQAAKSQVMPMEATAGADELDALMSSVDAQRSKEDVKKVDHLLRLTREQISQQRDLLDIADPHQEHRSTLSKT